MYVLLERFSYAPTETEGKLLFGGHRIYTIERPWVPHADFGGKPFESCVPDGVYDLKRWVSPTHGECFRLSSSAAGVHEDEQQSGRFAILIHPGNWVDDVVGCIAPGMARRILSSKRAVSRSTEAMRLLLNELDAKNSLVIRPKLGTRDMVERDG